MVIAIMIQHRNRKILINDAHEIQNPNFYFYRGFCFFEGLEGPVDCAFKNKNKNKLSNVK